MTTVLASGADRRYGWWLLNLIGSVQAKSAHTFDAIVLFDLGLSPFQRRLAAAIRGVELRAVPEFAPHWREGFTWKPWAWCQLEADRIVWLDSGATVLRPLDGVLAQIDERGYWVVSQQHPIGLSTPSDYWELFGVDPSLASRETVGAGVIGFARPSRFFESVIRPTYEDCLSGLSLGFSADEVERVNYGFNYNPAPLLRDCPLFRWDQTVLNLRFYGAYDDPVVNDHDRWAGKGPRDHPQQVLWHHRRRGDFGTIRRVRYRMPVALVGTPFGAAYRARWWLRLHRWLFRPSTYVGKVRRILAGEAWRSTPGPR